MQSLFALNVKPFIIPYPNPQYASLCHSIPNYLNNIVMSQLDIIRG